MSKMKTISTAVAVTCQLLLLLFCDVFKTSSAHPLSNDRDRWQNFTLRCNKTYKSESEEDTRYKIWKMNIEDISRHNSEQAEGKHDHTLGENCFADLTKEEFRSKFGLLNKPNRETRRRRRFALPPLPDMPIYKNTVLVEQLPDSVNWVEKPGWVRPVADQGVCGSCWAYAATAALEAQYFNNTNISITLSRQNLIDCSDEQGNGGCSGGYTHAALWYVKQNGIASFDSYPDVSDTTGLAESCKFRPSSSVMTIDNWMMIDENNELALQQAIAPVGPVAVYIDADDNLMYYSDGVFSESLCSHDNLNHVVLAVGYGVYNNQSYWLLKNSWTSSWGLDGYMMLARNMNNTCGVATSGVFPLMKLDNSTSANNYNSLDPMAVSTTPISSPVHSNRPPTTTTTTTSTTHNYTTIYDKPSPHTTQQ